MTNLTALDMQDLDRNLINDLHGDLSGWEAFEADYERATVNNQCWHIVYNADHQRGGIVFVGSGSSGYTEWTDASSAEDVLARLLAGEMAN